MARTLAEETIDLTPQPTGRASRVSPARVAARGIGLVDVSASRAPGWEWTIVVLALFLLARSPLFFYRQRIAELTDGRVFYIWQDDGVLRASTAVILFSVYVIAARRCDPRNLTRQPYLLAFLGLTLASTAWSVEPTVSLWRSAFFLATAVVGWYLGERYSIRDQIGIVGAMAALGAAASTVALLAWPKVTQVERLGDVWSGAYANRNWLGLVMSIGLLTTPFLWTILPRRRRILLLIVAGGEAFLLFKSESRTGLVALAAAAVVGLAIVGSRKLGLRPLGPLAGAVTVGLVVGYLGLVVHWNWAAVVRLLGRGLRLSGRTDMWQIDLAFAGDRPWIGWGFESIWAHPPTIARATASFGRFQYAAHNGYYEILLGVGILGFILFVLFLAVAAWRTFHFAWEGRDAVSMWPVVFFVFALTVNVTESLFISGEATWALTIAAAVAATRVKGPRRAVS